MPINNKITKLREEFVVKHLKTIGLGMMMTDRVYAWYINENLPQDASSITHYDFNRAKNEKVEYCDDHQCLILSTAISVVRTLISDCKNKNLTKALLMQEANLSIYELSAQGHLFVQSLHSVMVIIYKLLRPKNKGQKNYIVAATGAPFTFLTKNKMPKNFEPLTNIYSYYTDTLRPVFIENFGKDEFNKILSGI